MRTYLVIKSRKFSWLKSGCLRRIVVRRRREWGHRCKQQSSSCKRSKTNKNCQWAWITRSDDCEIYLAVCSVSRSVELLGWSVMLLEWQVLNQCHTVDVVEESHQQLKWQWKFEINLQIKTIHHFTHQLNDSPDGDDQAAKGKFRSANSHRCVLTDSLYSQ